eukprot:jgi/Tetstr1/454910/TSEL_041774.t1
MVPTPEDTSAPEPSPDVLPEFFWQILRGAEALPTPKHLVERPSKVVLLHGWLQDHTCWLKTAMKLRNTYGHDVLLLDFYGHGRSPYLANFHHMNIYTCVRQLRELLKHVGWLDQPVVLAGISFGGGVVQHYALRYPDHVERMVLLASVGQPEPTWRTIPLLVRLSTVISRQLLFRGSVLDADKHSPPNRPGLLTRLRGKLWIARKYPQHDLPDGIHHFLRRYPLTLVWGRYDTLHAPNLRRWLCKEPPAVPQSGSSSEDKDSPDSKDEQQQILLRLEDVQDMPETGAVFTDDATSDGKLLRPRNDVNILLVPMDHTLFCISIDSLRLHRYPHFWHGSSSPNMEKQADMQAAGPAGPLMMQTGMDNSSSLGGGRQRAAEDSSQPLPAPARDAPSMLAAALAEATPATTPSAAATPSTQAAATSQVWQRLNLATAVWQVWHLATCVASTARRASSAPGSPVARSLGPPAAARSAR